jgi:hypothetical protein
MEPAADKFENSSSSLIRRIKQLQQFLRHNISQNYLYSDNIAASAVMQHISTEDTDLTSPRDQFSLF